MSRSREPRPVRGDYVAWRTATTRWSDDDVYGHLNNARYFDLIDTAVNAHLAETTGTDIRRLPAIGVVAEVSCRYFAQLGYPRPIELGLAVERLGTSSVTYRIGLFQHDGSAETAPPAADPDQPANAEGRFVHVYVDNTDPTRTDRPVVPVPEAVRTALVPLRWRVVSATRDVRASSQAVFDLIADPARQPEWDGNDNLASAEPGHRVHAVGEVFATTLTRGTVRENHVVEFDEGRRIAWRPADVGQAPAGHLWRWEVEPLADDRARVVHTYDWSGLGDPERVARARATGPGQLRASLDRLAGLAERAEGG